MGPGQDCVGELLRLGVRCADTSGVNVTFAALNILVVVVLAVVFLLPKLREHQESKAEVPRSMRPNRAGQELADVVTEWAKTTGVLTPDGGIDPEHAANADTHLTDERS